MNHGLTIWAQPKGQNVQATGADTMVAASERLSYKIGDYTPYMGVEAKTPGWIAGNVYLDRNLTLWARLTVAAFTKISH